MPNTDKKIINTHLPLETAITLFLSTASIIVLPDKVLEYLLFPSSFPYQTARFCIGLVCIVSGAYLTTRGLTNLAVRLKGLKIHVSLPIRKWMFQLALALNRFLSKIKIVKRVEI